MARPRSFSRDTVVQVAKGVFWSQGYQRTAIEDLEQATGLNRSSIYAAFGTKRGIFTDALDSYLDDFIAPRLAPMRRAAAGPEDVEQFFAGLADHFRADAEADRGCLMVNSIAEHALRNDSLDGRREAFRDQLLRAFANALNDAAPRGSAANRARILTAATFGIWLTARIDPADAAGTCEATIAQVRSWR